jgi:beta-glucosidase-like glycosyl hydrolase
MQNYYQVIIPRMNGDKIKENFSYYLSLVKKGIAGFIVFGGELEEVRMHLSELQANAGLPLIVSADLERGLGQQVKGGTLFPPAMAIAKATIKGDGSPNLSLLRKTFRAVAEEARYAGINTIFAPVLDINTNPKNPIICTRAFGEDDKTVSLFGCEMIKTLQACGVAACGKHFPGHGDTAVDSHIKLPVITRGLRSLRNHELRPFKEAIKAGVSMIMVGHLSVPAVDPSGIPQSISERAVRYLRKNMGYEGVVITDAMNMGGIGDYSEEKASYMALKAGVDVILHPTDPERIVSHLAAKKPFFYAERLESFRRGLGGRLRSPRPHFDTDRDLSHKLTKKAITLSGEFKIWSRPFLIVLNDDEHDKSAFFVKRLRSSLPGMRSRTMSPGSKIPDTDLSEDQPVIVAVFSETKAWKGGASRWLFENISYLKNRANLFVSFGSPYLFHSLGRAAKIYAYSDDESAQEAVADLIAKKVIKSLTW